MTNAATRRARYERLRARQAVSKTRRSAAHTIVTLGILCLVLMGSVWAVSTLRQQAGQAANVVILYPGDHDGVCDAQADAPEWFSDVDCTDPAGRATMTAVCIGPAGHGHPCRMNTLRVRPCAAWDGDGTAHPCVWDAFTRGVGDCPRVAGVTVTECTGRFVYV